MRVGFVGLGNYARAALLPQVRKVSGAVLKRVATSTGISANNASEKYGFEAFSTSGSEIVDAPDIDVLFIATRHDTHAAYAAAGLEAGKHVFVEKPLALDLGQLDQVAAAAANSSGLLMMGLNRRFAPMLSSAKTALASAPGPKVMLYRVNAGAIPAESWIQRDEGGGRIIGEMCHFVDVLMHLAESAPAEVQAVAADGSDDSVSVLIRFTDGSTGTIVYSSLGDPSVPKEYIEVFAAGTIVQIDDFSRLLIASGGKRKRSKAPQDKGQSAMIAAFFDAIRAGLDPPIALEELVGVTETTFAVEQSLRTGAPVTIHAGQS
jgi:predicted dehydrogenase